MASRTISVVQRIRIIASGKFVQSFCGRAGDVVLTIHDGVGTAFVVPEEGAISHVDSEEAKALLNRIQIHRR